MFQIRIKISPPVTFLLANLHNWGGNWNWSAFLLFPLDQVRKGLFPWPSMFLLSTSGESSIHLNLVRISLFLCSFPSTTSVQHFISWTWSESQKRDCGRESEVEGFREFTRISNKFKSLSDENLETSLKILLLRQWKVNVKNWIKFTSDWIVKSGWVDKWIPLTTFREFHRSPSAIEEQFSGIRIHFVSFNPRNSILYSS